MSNRTVYYKSSIGKAKYWLDEYEKEALKQIGRIGTKAVRDNVYNVVTKRSGRLKRNISYRIVRKDKGVEIGIRKKIFYATALEKGHEIANKMTGRIGKSGKSLGRVKAYAFLLPAIESVQDKIQEIVKAQLKRMNNK